MIHQGGFTATTLANHHDKQILSIHHVVQDGQPLGNQGRFKKEPILDDWVWCEMVQPQNGRQWYHIVF